jgi:hypothetical protein
MTTEDKFQNRGPAQPDNSTLTPPADERTEVQGVKGIQGEAPMPDDQPKREDEDLSALLQNPNSDQKPQQ